jgi:hypothetical protein
MHESKTRDAVVGLIRNSGDLVGGLSEAAVQDLDLSAAARQHFWLAMVEAGIDLRKLALFGGVREARILQPEDISFIATQYRAAARDDHRACWLDLLFCIFDPANAAVLDELSGIANTDPLVADKLAAYTSCPLVPEDENLLKKAFERRRNAQAGAIARPEPSFSDLIEAHLRAFELGEPRAFSWVVEALLMDPDKPQGILFPTIRLADEKAWQSLPPELKQRILAAAPRYLEAQPVIEVEVWDEQHHYRTYDAVAPLLVLLFDQARSLLVALPPNLWRKWVPVLFTYHDRGGEVTPAHGMHLFRLAVLQSLISRSTPEACAAMVWLMRQRPGDFWLGDRLAAMRKAARGTLWRCPDPASLMTSFTHVGKRLVRTSGDLQVLLVESTRRFEKRLQGSPPSLELWNEITRRRKRIREPKDELSGSSWRSMSMRPALCESA